MAVATGKTHQGNPDPGTAPVKIGGRARTSDGTAVSNGQAVDAYFDEIGRLVVKAENADGTDIAGGEGGGGTQYAEDAAHASGNTGTLALAVRNDSNAVLTDTDLDYSAISVTSRGSVIVQPFDTVDVNVVSGDVDVSSMPKSATATLSTVADTASSTTLLASNANRMGATITNDSSARLYVKMGTTASATSYTYTLMQYDTLEVAFNYTGRIDGIWASDPGDGAARVTEFTA